MHGLVAFAARPSWPAPATLDQCSSVSLTVSDYPARLVPLETSVYSDRCGLCLMEGPPSSAPDPRTSKLSLADLSTELLVIIFEQLSELDLAAAIIARRVCKQFNAVATPIIYRTVSLNERIISRDAETRYSAALRNIFHYTNHLIVRSDLDPYGAKRVLDRTRNLRRVTWRYVETAQGGRRPLRPRDLLDNTSSARQKQIKLYVEDLPLQNRGGHLQETYTESIPPDLLVSLKLTTPLPPLSSQLQSLKELLVQARHLETLHYRDRGQGTHFAFSGRERLPAFRDLRLESYDWNHDSGQVEAHWDFSRLRSLALVSMPTHPFLTSVAPASLAGLHTLRVSDFSLHHLYRREEATLLLHHLVRHHIRALSSLDLRVATPLFDPLAALLPRHAATLHTLRLRDHAGFGDEARRCPTLPPRDVAALAAALGRLRALELDLDAAEARDVDGFLAACARFPRLRRLALHVHTLLRPDPDDGDGDGGEPPSDRDGEFAAGVFRALVRAPRQEPWERIVVNVGGWRRRGMVRRLSEAWRALNARGWFAERCFVLERVAGEGAEYRAWEEMEAGAEVGARRVVWTWTP